MIYNQLEGESIYPYMHPDYWDGNRIGIDVVACGEFAPFDHKNFAQHALQQYTDRSRLCLLHPEKMLGHGTQFNANEHPPGTILRYKRESLRLASMGKYVPEVEDLPVPDRLSATPNLHEEGEIEKFGIARYGYISVHAVVTPPIEGVQTTVSALNLASLQVGDYTKNWWLFSRTMPVQFEVGSVLGRYLIPRRNAVQSRMYGRILGIEIMGTYGKKQPKRVFDLGSLLKLKPAENGGAA